ELATTEKFRTASSRGGRVFCNGELTIRRPGKATVDGMSSAIYIGDGTILDNATLQINGTRSHIIIGHNCRLKSITIKVTGNDCAVLIGKNTTWESGIVNCDSGKAIFIGDDCMISNDVLMRVSDGHGIWDASSGEQL